MVSSTGRERTKVLLIYPPVRLAAAPRIPPFGYLYMGAVLEEAGMEVEILDQNVLRLPVDDLMTEIGNRDFDVIGIGGMTTVYYYIKLLSILLKQRYPDVPIMGGGSACTASPEIVLEHTGVDVVCIGEGEPVIVDLVNALTQKQPIDHIGGLYYRAADNSIVNTGKRERFLGWSNKLYPAHHLVDMEVYIQNNKLKYHEVEGMEQRIKELGVDPEKASRPVRIFSKRGCPFGCTFCFRNFGRKMVYDAPEATVDYMEFLADEYDTSHFVFGDELFNVQTKWVSEFCEIIKSRGRKYLLSTSNGLRANCTTEEQVLLMKEVGFYRLGIGIESFHDPSLKEMKKGQDAQTIFNAIKLLKKHGMFIGSSCLLFGYPTDSWEAMEANVKALTELDLQPAFAIPCPYPGTYLYEQAIERGLIKDEEAWLLELADKDVADRVVNLTDMSSETLMRIIQWGQDQLKVNRLRKRYPTAAALLNLVQHPLRRLLDVDAYEILQELKQGRLPRRKEPAKEVEIELNMDGANITNEKGLSGLCDDPNVGDRHVVAEALQRLQTLNSKGIAGLQFLSPKVTPNAVELPVIPAA